MKIPEELKAFLSLEGAEERLGVVRTLVTPAKKGELIAITSLVDEELTTFFAGYHAHPIRASDSDGKLRRKAKLAEKIEALRLVLPKLDPTAANYEHHLTFLDTLRRLRNKGSHESGISPEDATKLSQEPEVLAIIKGFPNALWAKVKELLKYLKSLTL